MEPSETHSLGHNLLLRYSCELADALQFLHQKNIAHHDVKPNNCLIDKVGRLKLSDFGLAQKYDDTECASRSGTMAYFAPEVFEKEPYDPFKADIWALGVTLYYFMMRELPFKDVKSATRLKIEQQLFRMNRSLCVDPLSTTLVRVITMALCVDPNKRAPIDRISKELHSLKQHMIIPHMKDGSDSTAIFPRQSLPQFVPLSEKKRPRASSNIVSVPEYYTNQKELMDLKSLKESTPNPGQVVRSIPHSLKGTTLMPKPEGRKRLALSILRSGVNLTFSELEKMNEDQVI